MSTNTAAIRKVDQVATSINSKMSLKPAALFSLCLLFLYHSCIIISYLLQSRIAIVLHYSLLLKVLYLSSPSVTVLFEFISHFSRTTEGINLPNSSHSLAQILSFLYHTSPSPPHRVLYCPKYRVCQDTNRTDLETRNISRAYYDLGQHNHHRRTSHGLGQVAVVRWNLLAMMGARTCWRGRAAGKS